MAKLDAIIPHLTVDGAAAAIDFYKTAFGAEEVGRHLAEDGKRLMHGHVRINGHDVFLHDLFPEHGMSSAKPAGVTMALRVDDTDAWWDRAVKGGATIVMALDNQFWGDRFGLLSDPFGHSWSISAPVKG